MTLLGTINLVKFQNFWPLSPWEALLQPPGVHKGNFFLESVHNISFEFELEDVQFFLYTTPHGPWDFRVQGTDLLPCPQRACPPASRSLHSVFSTWGTSPPV